MPSLITEVMFTLMLDIFLGGVVGNSGAAALCSRNRSEVSLPNVTEGLSVMVFANFVTLSKAIRYSVNTA